ncbi:MAG: ArsR family transcriptional regulator [Candidatus Eremiobacteraeota bacterium]|nr:ArsR family transcriptional regulator [Candidatus Eremiobacteraeota bacterium]
MNAEDERDIAAARIASSIGEPARARILYSLMDGRARTSTELAIVAGVSPSTASVHLRRLTSDRLVTVAAQGKHRYFCLRGAKVARVLEGLNILAGASGQTFVPSTPTRLRSARTCYDHMAGTVSVALHDRFIALDWLRAEGPSAYDVTEKGAKHLGAIGIDVSEARAMRRRFAYACLDWSERRPHIGGAIGSAILESFLRKRWVSQQDDSRALSITAFGRRELCARFGDCMR